MWPCASLHLFRDDVATLSEDDAATLFGSVLANDDVPDLVRSIELVPESGPESGPGAGVLTFNTDGSFGFDPAGAFDDLAEGESRVVSFDYIVTDANGDTDVATARITVTAQTTRPRSPSRRAIPTLSRWTRPPRGSPPRAG